MNIYEHDGYARRVSGIGVVATFALCLVGIFLLIVTLDLYFRFTHELDRAQCHRVELGR